MASEKESLGEDCKCQNLWIENRYCLAALVFLGLFNAFSQQANLGVVSVAMIKSNVTAGNSEFNQSCPNDLDLNLQENSTIEDFLAEIDDDGEFAWDEYTQGIILGAFFCGFFPANLIGGRVVELIGAKMAFGGSVFLSSVFTLLTPLAAKCSNNALIVVRALEGISQGPVYPALNFLTANWFHESERGFMYTMMYSGVNVGQVVSTALSGYLCSKTFLGGWPSVFYIFGVSGIFWCVPWFLCMRNYPVDHPRISRTDLLFNRRNSCSTNQRKVKMPWSAILTSFSVWACALIYFSENWGTNLLLDDQPTFMDSILHYNIKQNGVISSLTPMVQSIGSIIFGVGADKILQRFPPYGTRIRKILIAIGSIPPAAALLLVTFSGCNRTAAVVMLLFSSFFSGCLIPGVNLSLVHMSPVFSGTLTGICNGFGEIAGFVAPYIVGILINEMATLEQWHKVFYISSAIYIVPCVFFIVFGNTDRQHWTSDCKKPDDFRTKSSGKLATSL